MRRERTRVTITITMTHSQREIVRQLKGDRTQAGYIRQLIAEDARRKDEYFLDEPQPYRLAARQ